MQAGLAAALTVATAFSAVACGDGNEPPVTSVELGDATSLPAASGDGAVLIYRAVREGLLNSVGVDASSGEELWSVVDSSFEPTLERPGVIDDVLFAADFDDENLAARVRAIDVVTGAQLWSSPLGPHYAGPYECGADIVCVHAHPEASPVSTWQFHRGSGRSAEGRAGGRTIYADEEIQVSERTTDATLVLSRDADASAEWTSSIVDTFGPDHGAVDGSWVRRSADRMVVWFGRAGVLDGTFAVFEIDSPDPVGTYLGVPCLVEDADVDVICARSDDQLRLLDWDGNVIDEVTVPPPDGEIVPDHVYDEAGRLVIVAERSYRLEVDGFSAVPTPTKGWCPDDDDDFAATETARSQPVEIAGSRYYPCSPTDREPLDVEEAADLAHEAADSANSKKFMTATSQSLAFHTGRSTGITIIRR